ncbi:hypothetical protein B9Z19DRAFT_522336 [Tuber borchii]|uniref:Uncharacterized protein n=1 Tax=Tuber borchii TaxID=42251 RepID=A0A2T6ZDY3_TUBBO|nr:hypothetical protein B9Z19DRAFT_522336 [Tuber borchii]
MMIVDECEGRPCADLWQLLVSFVTSLRASHSPTRLTCVQAIIQVLEYLRGTPWFARPLRGHGGGRSCTILHQPCHASPTSQQEEKGSWSIDLFFSPFQEGFSRKEVKKKKRKTTSSCSRTIPSSLSLSIFLSPLPSLPLALLMSSACSAFSARVKGTDGRKGGGEEKFKSE